MVNREPPVLRKHGRHKNGSLSRLWARRILDRLRDAVAVTVTAPPCHALLHTDPDREAIRDFNLGRSRARGVQHRCARFV
jgi:hypothetical protein